ncbi:MAG: hypothetical protein ACYC03_17720, partial [Acidovorax defluvii]
PKSVCARAFCPQKLLGEFHGHHSVRSAAAATKSWAGLAVMAGMASNAPVGVAPPARFGGYMTHLLKERRGVRYKATGRHRAGRVPGDGCSAQMREKKVYRRAKECATGL